MARYTMHEAMVDLAHKQLEALHMYYNILHHFRLLEQKEYLEYLEHHRRLKMILDEAWQRVTSR